MAGNYIEVVFTLPRPGSVQQDLLIAGLGEAGYESFLETATGFNAYIPAGRFSEGLLKAAIDEVAATGNYDGAAAAAGDSGAGDVDDGNFDDTGRGTPFAYETRLVESQNWNKVWESNFNPVVIGKECRIRASFHEPDPAFPLEILIDPKMSFGTGHHETTWLMASWLLELPIAGKRVLDMGCGTGVLAILAAKKGALNVVAADIDPQCIESTRENAALNDTSFQCLLTSDGEVPGGDFDIILANINRNVLLHQLPGYAGRLNHGGTLLLSGFYEGTDLDMLREKAAVSSLDFQQARSKNRWTTAQFFRK